MACTASAEVYRAFGRWRTRLPEMQRAQRIKFCGITDPADVDLCVRAGAWAIGAVMTAHGPRALDAGRAAVVMAEVPVGVERVGVFVQAQPDAVARAVQACGLTRVQLHRTDDVAGVARAAGVPVTLAIPLIDTESIAEGDAADCDLVLFDAAVPGADGGTGVRADWSLFEERRPSRPFALAGGLTPMNVGEAVRRVRPDVLDVSSGVETEPGRKDPDRVAAFSDAARQAAMEVTA